MLLYTIYKDPRKSLRSAPGFLVANLSVADLLLGLLNLSIVAVRDVYRSQLINMPLLLLLLAKDRQNCQFCQIRQNRQCSPKGC